MTGRPQGKRRRVVTGWRLVLTAAVALVSGAATAAGADDEWVRAITRHDLPVIERLLSRNSQYVNKSTKEIYTGDFLV